MKLYADLEYYVTEFSGEKLPDYEIEKFLEMAQAKIDSVTFNRINAIGFENLTPFQQEKVKQAVCYQAEYICESGYDSNDANIASYSVLDISVNMKSDGEKTAAKRANMSEIAYDLINQTGLTCRRL